MHTDKTSGRVSSTALRQPRARWEAKDLSFTPTGDSVPRMESRPIIQEGTDLGGMSLQA